MHKKFEGRDKKIIATIEARMGASRLPNKMAVELYPGLPALGAVIKRLKAASRLDDIVVATTIKKDDDILVDIAARHDAGCFRGSETDVLGRVVGAGREYKADILVLVTGDCSCISPSLIDEGIDFFLKNDYDLVTNLIQETYPVGIDLQVVKYSSLAKSYEMAQLPGNRSNTNNFEHTNYFIRTHPDTFRIHHYIARDKYHRPDIILALDTPADLEVLRRIYSKLYPKNKYFDIDEILGLLNKEPDILKPLKGLNIDRVGIK